MSKMVVFLKWLLYMLPGFAGQALLTYLFQPQSIASQSIGLPIFILLSFGNLFAYHLFMVPKRVKDQLATVFKKYTDPIDFEDYEEMLTKIIEDAKARQSVYDGFKKSDLIRLQHRVEVAKRKFSFAVTMGQWILCGWAAGIVFYILYTPKFNLNIIFILWSISLLVSFTLHNISKRHHKSAMDVITLRRCIEKCDEKQTEIFQFDNDL